MVYSVKKKINYNKIELNNAEINFDLNQINEYKKFSKKEFNLKPINLKNSELKFFEGSQLITTISDMNFKYKFGTDVDEAILKGIFLNDRIHINFKNKKNKKDPSKILVLKLLDFRLFTKINIFNPEFQKNLISGNLLFKKDKNRLTGTFDYKDNKIIIKHANIRNAFLDGKLEGELKFLPYFNFDLYADLNSLNFNSFYGFFNSLNEKSKKQLFKVNNKINGQLNLSTEKIYSKYNFVNSFESRIKFTNGNILIEQLILNLGKLGAADITGIIKNYNKFTNLIFENNIFIDNKKYFYSKFGIYNKQNVPSNIFVSGKFDLINLKMYFDEISNGHKYKDEDIVYIEKEFNNIVLDEGYKSFFNYLNLKVFIKLINTEIDYINMD